MLYTLVEYLHLLVIYYQNPLIHPLLIHILIMKVFSIILKFYFLKKILDINFRCLIDFDTKLSTW
jgi:hypothetical protein